MLTNTQQKYRLTSNLTPPDDTRNGTFLTALIHLLNVILPRVDTGSKRFLFGRFEAILQKVTPFN
jgi:hypothetical protein